MKQMRNIREEIVPLIKETLQTLTGSASDNEVSLLLGTAAAESGLTFRKQLGGGPARGLWQMEPGMTGAQDIFENYLRYPNRRRLYDNLTLIWFELDGVPYWTPKVADLEFHLEINDRLACALARIKYLRDPDAIPESVKGQAGYWKRVYNTPAGAGTAGHYLEAWESCGCAELLREELKEVLEAIEGEKP